MPINSGAPPDCVQVLFGKIRPYFGVALDFDDTLVCSEIVTAGVTANLINPILIAAGNPPLTAQSVCCNYSGLNFKKQAALLQENYNIEIPAQIIQQKEQGNLVALAKEAQALPGSIEFLSFIEEFRFNAMVLTASKQNRVRTTAQCAGLDCFLASEDSSDDSRIPVISAGESTSWKGLTIPELPHKPAPDGYRFVAKALGLDPQQMIAFEDSSTGVQAAIAAEYRHVAIVSLSRRCAVIPDHVEELEKIVGDKSVIVKQSWLPAVEAMLKIGIEGARKAGVADIPKDIPSNVMAWLIERFPPVGGLSSFAPATKGHLSIHIR